MSDFCRQCSIEYFGWDYADQNDFQNLITENESNGGQYAIVELCEGCGVTWIGPNGVCIGDCAVHHNARLESMAMIPMSLVFNIAL